MFQIERDNLKVIALFYLFHVWTSNTGLAQPAALQKPGMQIQQLTQPDSLKQQIDQLNRRVDLELKTANMRFEAVIHSTDRAFNMLYGFGAIGSFIGGLFVILTWRREKRAHTDYEHERRFYEDRVLRSHKDYEQERKFYESRVLDFEKRQNENQERDTRFANQQLEIGNNVLLRSDDMLSKQIESIGKLGGVIDLVQKAFQMQLKREEEQKELQNQLKAMDVMVSSFKQHFERQYGQLIELILAFKDHSRMAWTRLSMHEETIATRARNNFETIPEFVLEEKKKENPSTLARIYQLLGVSAFYANDVDAAAKYLQSANSIYVEADTRPEDLYPHAFCSYFLGIVEKSWRHTDRSLEANLGEARRHLEDANRLLAEKPGEFLTPLTLAEVLSYSERTRDNAVRLLDEKIAQLESMKASKNGLDDNQQALLARAYLLRGNLDYSENRLKEALKWYKRSADEVRQKHYAWLSIAFSIPSDQSAERKQWFQKGLEALEQSEALRKSEDVVRIIALVWAVVAAHELGDKQRRERYLKDYKSAGVDVRSVGRREPLFFCPLTKNLVTLKQLNKNVMQAIDEE